MPSKKSAGKPDKMGVEISSTTNRQKEPAKSQQQTVWKSDTLVNLANEKPGQPVKATGAEAAKDPPELPKENEAVLQGSVVDTKETESTVATSPKRQAPAVKSEDSPELKKVKLEEVKSKEIDDFESPMRILLVGPDKKCSSAHESKLSQSPVLAQMCRTLPAGLPIPLAADDVHIVKRAINFLYYGNYRPYDDELDDENAPKSPGLWAESAHLLAGMYIFGQRYELVALKDLTIKKLENLFFSDTEHRDIYFAIFLPIYQNIPASDAALRDAFRQKAEEYFTSMAKPSVDGLLDNDLVPGFMLKDIMEAYREGLAVWAANKAKETHKVHHAKCYKCLFK